MIWSELTGDRKKQSLNDFAITELSMKKATQSVRMTVRPLLKYFLTGNTFTVTALFIVLMA
jgi:hypothetical protein